MNNKENQFIEWLKDEVKTQSPISSYPKALKFLLPQKLNEIGEEDYKNIFECEDLVYLDKLYNRLSSKGDLSEFNRETRNQLPSAAIKKYIQFLKQINKPKKSKSKKIIQLNQILYGPPGTGKTYNTINRALEIIDGKVPKERAEAKKRFEALSEAGQIEFVTFHQSYGYEEFVEGIKASTLDGEISYDVEDGVFKKLCKLVLNNNLFNDNFQEKINEYRTLLEKEKIVLYTKTGIPFEVSSSPYGVITQTEHSFSFEKLININKNIFTSNPDETYGKFIVEDINKRFAKETALKSENKNHIIIIDEINRGNISKIFGELITLIEPSKRLDADEEIKIRLPYSNEIFGVPQNLYIIGTMNTADRSIALLDTALRRRFDFVEMMPKVELLDFEIENIHLGTVLQTINARVEYLYDREHTIGHAYFMELNAESTLDDLNVTMKNKIIPLLQEYFYDDWKKISLVLNDGFIEELRENALKIFETIDDEYLEEDKMSYSVKSYFEIDAYERLCQIR